MGALADLEGTTWAGTNQLWLDPEAPGAVSDGTMTVEAGRVRYTWAFEGKEHAGSVELHPDGSGATFTDTWHQVLPMSCRAMDPHGALVSVVGAYGMPDGPKHWSWRILVCLRPTGELVLQMLNGTPWGEEHRAVLLVARR